MCYLLITKQLVDQPSKETADSLRKVMKDQMKLNDDGFSLQKPAENLYHQTMAEKEMFDLIDKTDIDGTIFHARFASAGKTDISNVHGYKKNGWTFSHNGGIREYTKSSQYKNELYVASGKNQEHTDSKLFFYDLVDEIEARKASGHKDIARAIQAMLNEVTLWGRASLYHLATDRLFLFGDWHTYNFKGEYIAISSADLGKPQTSEVVIRGLTFEQPSSSSKSMVGELDGIVVIKNFSKPNWSLKFLSDGKNYQEDKKCGTTRVAEAYERDKIVDNALTTPAITSGSGFTKHGHLYDDDYGYNFHKPNEQVDEFIDEYMYNIDGELVAVYMDETGIHDNFGDCCRTGMCDYFFDTMAQVEKFNADMVDEFVETENDKFDRIGEKTEEEKQEILERLSH